MSNDRTLKVTLNARAGIMRNLAGGLISLATVPLALRALGVEGYGTFQVLLSVANLTVMSDVGLGLALFTRVGQLAGAKQHDQIPHAVGGAMMVIGIVVALLASAALVALAALDVPRFLETPSNLREEVQNGLYLILGAFALRMPLSALGSAHGGLQIGNRLLGWNVGGAIASSIGMVAAAMITKRVDVAIGVQMALSLAGVVGAARLGCRLEPASRPVFRRQNVRLGWGLLRSGFFYYLLQVETMLIGGLDNLVLAKVVGVEAVAIYSVGSRVISIAFSFVQSLGSSFWPGVAHAIGHGDLAWIRSEADRLRRVGVLWMAIFSAGFVAVGEPLVALWTGGRLHLSPWLTLWLGIYYALVGHTMIDTAILNGAERIRQQILTVGLDAGLKLLLSVWLAGAVGYPGVALATVIAYSICSFVPLQYLSWKMVIGGSRPRFWTAPLAAMIPSVLAGFAIARLPWPDSRSGHAAALVFGGAGALIATLLSIRLIVGPAGLEALRRGLRRTPAPSNSSLPGSSP